MVLRAATARRQSDASVVVALQTTVVLQAVASLQATVVLPAVAALQATMVLHLPSQAGYRATW